MRCALSPTDPYSHVRPPPQIVSTFLHSLDVPWPHVFQALMAKCGIINLNLLQLPKSACLHPQPLFYKQFLGYSLAFLLALVAMGAIWLFGSRVLWRFTLRGMGAVERDARLSRFNSTVLQRLLLFSYLTYPGVSVVIISMFSCTTLDGGKSYLNADFRIVCWTREHNAYVAAAVVMTLLVPLGVPYFFMKLLQIFKVPQMARMKVDNAWLVEGVKEVWKRGAPQPSVNIEELNVETISALHLEVMHAVLVKKASAEKAAGILSGAVAARESVHGDDGHEHEDVSAIAAAKLRRAAARQAGACPTARGLGSSTRIKKLSLVQRVRVKVEMTRVRVAAFINPGGKNAAKLLAPPTSAEARRAHLLTAVLSWCKHSGGIAIPAVDWKDSDLLARTYSVPHGPTDKPFTVQSYGLSCVDLPRLQKRALREVGFLYCDYIAPCWYWESVELGRKLVLTSILTLISPGSAGQVLVGLLIAFFMLVLNLRLRPYADAGLNSMNGVQRGALRRALHGVTEPCVATPQQRSRSTTCFSSSSSRCC